MSTRSKLPSAYVTSDILFDCLQQKEQGDIAFKNFQYSEALRNYENTQVCIDDFIRFSKTKKTSDQEMIETLNAIKQEVDNKIKVVERIQTKTKVKKEQTQNRNLYNFEMLVNIMIMEENYDELMNFINISPKINQMIESVLSNPKTKEQGKIVKIDQSRLKQLSKTSANKLIKLIKDCNNRMIIYLYFLTTNVGSLEDFQKLLENNLYKKMTKFLEQNQFKLYKNSYYRLFTNKNPEKLKKLSSEINKDLRDYFYDFLSDIPELDCIKNKIQREFALINIS